MCCEQIERLLGSFLDDRMSATRRRDVEAHLAYCSSCRAELNELHKLVGGISRPEPVAVPTMLWSRIEQRLNDEGPGSSPAPSRRVLRMRHAPWAIAAGVLLIVSLGLTGLVSLDTPARASAVDFGVLLDALPLDAHKAFRKFLVRYDAKRTTPAGAKRYATDLNFATPAKLPGGFELRSVYELRIGELRGIAASYDRNGEFLAAVFHPPMPHESFGTHENYACVIGKHCGHKVQVGQWKLVHLTDPTTCHCLLSRLDEEIGIPQVMSAIAPELRENTRSREHP